MGVSVSLPTASYHFDGERYYNPTLPQGFVPSISSVFKLLLEERSKWPKSVPNVAVPKLNEKLVSNGFAVTFVNHATFLLQISGLNILTDPIWSRRVSPFRWLGPARVREPGIAFDELPNIGLILLTHNHYDHMDLDTLTRLNQRFAPTSNPLSRTRAALVSSLQFLRRAKPASIEPVLPLGPKMLSSPRFCRNLRNTLIPLLK